MTDDLSAALAGKPLNAVGEAERKRLCNPFLQDGAVHGDHTAPSSSAESARWRGAEEGQTSRQHLLQIPTRSDSQCNFPPIFYLAIYLFI